MTHYWELLGGVHCRVKEVCVGAIWRSQAGLLSL